MPSTRDSAVLGLAIGYGSKEIGPFAQSLRRSGFRGRLVLFVDGLSREKRAEVESIVDVALDAGDFLPRASRGALARFSTHMLGRLKGSRHFKRYYPIIFRLVVRTRFGIEQRLSAWIQLEKDLQGWIALRHFIYAKYLETHQHDLVMLSDVRDVLFQADPFDQPLKSDLEVTCESSRVPICASQCNKEWLEVLYGPAVLFDLADRPISCAGTVLGTYEGICRYLSQTCSQMLKLHQPLGPYDQGVHNYLVWTGALQPVTIYENGAGPIYTAGYETDLLVDSEGRVLNLDGRIAAVVHQYDRHAAYAGDLLRTLAHVSN